MNIAIIIVAFISCLVCLGLSYVSHRVLPNEEWISFLLSFIAFALFIICGIFGFIEAVNFTHNLIT